MNEHKAKGYNIFTWLLICDNFQSIQISWIVIKTSLCLLTNQSIKIWVWAQRPLRHQLLTTGRTLFITTKTGRTDRHSSIHHLSAKTTVSIQQCGLQATACNATAFLLKYPPKHIYHSFIENLTVLKYCICDTLRAEPG